MSRADLNPAIQADYDAARRRWLVSIPLDHIEEQMHRRGERWAPGPAPSHEDLRRTGVRLGEHVAEVLAKPGPMQREVRARVKKNNRRRFGP